MTPMLQLTPEIAKHIYERHDVPTWRVNAFLKSKKMDEIELLTDFQTLNQLVKESIHITGDPKSPVQQVVLQPGKSPGSAA